MLQREISVLNPVGVHARPASKLVEIAHKYNCEVKIKANGKELLGKSMLSILSAGIKYQDQVVVVCDGPEEHLAMDLLVEVLENEAI